VSIAVVIPVRNGAHLLADCISAIAAQTRPPDEVLVVVGPSRDGTRELAQQMAGDALRVLDNPDGDRASAINVALAATDAGLVALVDAQARIGPGYLQHAAEVLSDRSVAVVGGPMRPVGSTTVGRAMAAALQSPFGVGDSQFHFAGTARDVESVYLGVYRRAVFDRVGPYNPALLRTEDDDLNARIREAGMRIRLDPSIQSTYRCRESLADIWRQYHGYGFWKVALATIRPSAIRRRHLVPAAFVLSLAIGGVVAILGWWQPLLVFGTAWALVALIFTIRAPASGVAARALFPVVALTMHLAYGVGTLWGATRWPQLAKRVREAQRAPSAVRE
jgi:GT2 family glycosyltransferase